MILHPDQALCALAARFRSSMLNIDLHCHSNVSDGVLTPADLVARAAANGVHVLALTDHDDVAGIAAAQAAADAAGLTLIPGVEISVSWGGQTVHIVGLRIDPAHPALAAGLHSIRLGRIDRARRMADDLAQSGIDGAYEGAFAYAANKQMLGRTHFARWLVAQGHAPDMRTAFRRFLTRGNPGVSRSSPAAIILRNTASSPTWRAPSASRPRAARTSMRRARVSTSAACPRCRTTASPSGKAGRNSQPIYPIHRPEYLWRNSSISIPTTRSPA